MDPKIGPPPECSCLCPDQCSAQLYVAGVGLPSYCYITGDNCPPGSTPNATLYECNCECVPFYENVSLPPGPGSLPLPVDTCSAVDAIGFGCKVIESNCIRPTVPDPGNVDNDCNCTCVLPPDTCVSIPFSTIGIGAVHTCLPVNDTCTFPTPFVNPGKYPTCDCECVGIPPEDIQNPWPGYCYASQPEDPFKCDIYDRCQPGYVPVSDPPTCNNCTCELEPEITLPETCTSKPDNITQTCDVTWNLCIPPMIPDPGTYPACNCSCIIPDENATLPPSWDYCFAKPVGNPPTCNITVDHCFPPDFPYARPPGCAC